MSSPREAILKHGKRFAVGALVFGAVFSAVWAGMHGYEFEIIMAVTALVLIAFTYILGWAIEDFREMNI